MANRHDSNLTGLAYAEEEATEDNPIGELGNNPVWRRLLPNTYPDFGGEVTTIAPNPINPSRQRRKGVISDLTASGGFNQNLNFHNLTDLMQGVMFADIRRTRARVTAMTGSSITVDALPTPNFPRNQNDLLPIVLISGHPNDAQNGIYIIASSWGGTSTTIQLISITSDFGNIVRAYRGNLTSGLTGTQCYIELVGCQCSRSSSDDIYVSAVHSDGSATINSGQGFNRFIPGQWIYFGANDPSSPNNSFTNAANNGFKRVRRIVSDSEMIVDKSEQPMVQENTSAQKVIPIFFGPILRNESGALIKRRSYHLERTLVPAEDEADSQYEIVKGAVPSEFTLNIPQAELVNADFTFAATDHQIIKGEWPLSSDNNGNSQVQSFPAADSLNASSDIGRIRLSTYDNLSTRHFAFISEATLSINNNITPNKAVGVLGAFDVTAGTFQVSGEITAYFAEASAVQAVRANTDATLDFSFVKDNQAIVFDLPLISLGNGRLNIEIDNPITLPLTAEAASGEDIESGMNHTLCITYFPFVPE